MDNQNLRRLARAAATVTQPAPTQSQTEPRTFAMNSNIHSATSANSSSWLTFTYVQFGAAALMSAVGIWAMPVDLMVKGYLMMSSVFLVGSAFTLAKTVRDEHEARRFASRIDEARTEKLLMEVGRN